MFGALAINIAVFLEVLDMTIINVAVPAIAGNFGTSQTEATWAITSYALMAAVSQPLTAWMSRRFGETRLFMASTLLFTLTSALCGMAPTMHTLVLFRLLQGLVSGPMVPLSQALVLTVFPPHRKTLAQALWAVCGLVGPIFGPILGGWITDSWSWRWAFFINLPSGLFAVTLMWFFLRGRDGARQKLPLDIVGASLLILAVGSLQFLIDHGRQEDWLESPFIVRLLITSLLSFALFAAWNHYERHPIADFALLRRRNYVSSVIVLVGSYGVMLGVLVVYSLWLQGALGYSATTAGLASASFGTAAMLSGIALGFFGQRLPMRTAVSIGLLLMAAGSVWLALLPGDASFWQLTIPRSLHGIAPPRWPACSH